MAGWQASQSITALLTTNDQFLLLSIIACIRLIARHDKMVRLSPFLDTQLVTGVLGCCTGVSREEMTYRLRTDSYDLKPQYFSDRHWLRFSFHFDHLARSLQIDKINGDCQDNQWSKYIKYL